MNTSASVTSAETTPDRSLYPLVTRRRVELLLADYREQLTTATDELKLVQANNKVLTAAMEAQQAIIERLTNQRDLLHVEHGVRLDEIALLKAQVQDRDHEIDKLRAMVADPIADKLADALHESELELERCVQERDALKQQCTDAQPTPDVPQTVAMPVSDAPTAQSSKKARTPRRRAVQAVQGTMAESEASNG